MRSKLLVVVLVFAAVAGCQHDNGKKSLTQKEKAVEQWNRTRASVMASLARNQYESGHFDQSQQTVNDALRLDPQNVELRLLSARLDIEQGQLDVAEKTLTLVRQIDEKNAEAEYLAGIVYQRWQKPELAYECYLRASQKNPAELAYVLARAEMLVAMNCGPEALAALRAKLGEFEHNAVLHHAIGQLLVDQEQYPQAVESLRQASMLAPEDASIREHLAMAHFHNRQYPQASAIFERILRDQTSQERHELWIALGECQMQMGRASDARNSFDKATQLSPSSMTAWLSLAKATLELGDTRRAEIVLRKAIALDGGSAEAHLMLGYVRLRQERLNEAFSEFQKATSLDDRDPVSLCMLGYVLEKSGKPEQAMQYYARALRLKPDDELAARLMASVEIGD